MTWKGVVIEESLSKPLKVKVGIRKTKKTYLESEKERGMIHFLYVEIDDKEKEKFIAQAKNFLKEGWYIHVCSKDEMIIIFKDRVFRIMNSDDVNKARNYGLSVGIKKEQMDFEKLLGKPWG